MKKLAAAALALLLFTGCSGKNAEMERGLNLRAQLLKAAQCRFSCEITADYGEKLYTFSMDCQGDDQGNLTFCVTAPETISGITGSVDDDGGKLTFDGNALAFTLLADGQVSPVSGPWLLMKTLRSGYLTSCGMEDGCLRIAIDDSYADDALHLDIWLDGNDLPTRGEILWQGRRILSVSVKNFVFL